MRPKFARAKDGPACYIESHIEHRYRLFRTLHCLNILALHGFLILGGGIKLQGVAKHSFKD